MRNKITYSMYPLPVLAGMLVERAGSVQAAADIMDVNRSAIGHWIRGAFPPNDFNRTALVDILKGEIERVEPAPKPEPEPAPEPELKTAKLKGRRTPIPHSSDAVNEMINVRDGDVAGVYTVTKIIDKGDHKIGFAHNGTPEHMVYIPAGIFALLPGIDVGSTLYGKSHKPNRQDGLPVVYWVAV